MEYRIKDVELQCEDGLLKIGGYINVTERESELLYSKKRGKWFKEIMKRGVFETAISRAKEIPLLLEHNWENQLATTANQSLTLKEDQIGLRFDAIIDDMKIYEQVKLGVVNSCSFGFRALAQEFEKINERLEKRFVTGIELLEVSLVKNPAYVGSLVESRAYEEEIDAVTENVDESVVTEEVRAEDKKSEEKPKEEVKEESKDETKKESKDEAKDDSKKAKEDNSKDEEKVESEEEVEEKPKDKKIEAETDKETKDEKDNTEDRTVLDSFIPVTEVNEESNNVKTDLVEVVDTVIAQKEEQLTCIENQEQDCKMYLEAVTEEHINQEQELEATSNFLSTEVIKLRLELLKLKRIKENI